MTLATIWNEASTFNKESVFLDFLDFLAIWMRKGDCGKVVLYLVRLRWTGNDECGEYVWWCWVDKVGNAVDN